MTEPHSGRIRGPRVSGSPDYAKHDPGCLCGYTRGKWKSALIDCEPGFEDLVSNLIFEAGFSGLEERMVAGRTRFAVYSASLPDSDPLGVLAFALESHSGNSSIPPARILAVETLPDTDWESSWREGFGAVEAGRCLVVRPSWVKYENTDSRIEIIIDPKMAFGNGGHATTRLCLDALERLDLSGKTILDAGCGSGVLSIAAAKLGALRVHGFDNDPFSIENARENILLNGVADRVTVIAGELALVEPEPAEIVLANIISGLIISHLPRFRSFLSPGGVAVFSGLLAEEEDSFLGHLRREWFSIRAVERCEEWIAVVADRS